MRADVPGGPGAYATFMYVGITVLAAIYLSRAGVTLRRLGFGPPFRPLRFLLMAIVGVALIQLLGWSLEPLWESLFGAGRDLARFSDVGGSPAALVKLLVLSWAFAAFGEELAFRIVLMRGIAFTLGDSRRAFGIALVVQAIVFGLVHSYQGPAGVVGATINGLVFGGPTLIARGSIWPAALTHGIGCW